MERAFPRAGLRAFVVTVTMLIVAREAAAQAGKNAASNLRPAAAPGGALQPAALTPPPLAAGAASSSSSTTSAPASSGAASSAGAGTAGASAPASAGTGMSAPRATAPVEAGRAPAAAPLPGSGAAVSEARTHFARGVQAFKEGAFATALVAFEQAYTLAPAYRLHFNIAQTQYELRNYVEAQRSFRRYLGDSAGNLPADRRELVETELKKLDTLVAQLSIKTSVSDVQIVIDDVPAAVVQQGNQVLVSVNPGVRRVSAAKAGFLPANLIVTASPGERQRLAFELAPLAGASPVVGGASPLVAERLVTPPAPDRTRTWISLAAATALGIGTGVLALSTRTAHNDFEAELARVPNDHGTIERSRSRLTRLAALTDALGAATAIATGFTVYFALTEGQQTRETAPSSFAFGMSGRF